MDRVCGVVLSFLWLTWFGLVQSATAFLSLSPWPEFRGAPQDSLYDLEDNLLLFFTGYSRAASNILREQNERSRGGDQEIIENLHFVKEVGLRSKLALEAGDLPAFANLMDIHWKRKKERSGNMSNPKINEWYELALENGALGGKLIGAGGGGFLMFYAADKVRLRKSMREAGLTEVRFHFEFEGAKQVI